MLLLLLLTGVGESLFTQASILRLRAEPSAKGKVVRELAIGTPCSVSTDEKDGWLELNCSGTSGFAKAEMLGPKAPDLSALRADMRDAKKSVKDRLTAASRALALAAITEEDFEGSSETREVYRTMFYDAELDRLREARAKKDTLKVPKVVTEACTDKTETCVARLAAKTQPLDADWSNTVVKGDDFIYAAILLDNDIYVASGEYKPGVLTVQLTYKSSIEIGAVQALSDKQKIGGCYSASLIGCAYEFDQNCAPDNCWDPYQSCKQGASKSCTDCSGTCVSTCLDCRAACKGKNAACLQKCGQRGEACSDKCAGRNTKTLDSCESEYKTCSDKEERWWKKNCEAACTKYRSCIEKAKDSSRCTLKSGCERCMY